MDLVLGVGVVELDLFGVVVGVGDLEGEGVVGGKGGEAQDAEAVLGLDAVVVGGVGEGECEEALFFEVGFGDAGEGSGDDDVAAAVSDFHGGVFAAGAFAVVVVADDGPASAGGFVGAGDFVDGLAVLAGELVEGGAGVAAEGVDAAAEEVAGDVVEVSAVAEPGAGGGDVVGGGFAFGFEQEREVGEVVAVPRVEGGEALEAVAVGVDDDVDVGAVVGRGR